MKKLCMLLAVALLLAVGCSPKKLDQEKPAEELAAEGLDQFNKESYHQAIETFKKLKDWYPFSKKAIMAELKIADSHYFLKSYEEAVVAYEEFVNLHPRNEAAPYVMYQIGRCHFDQIEIVDRDQTATQKALDGFNRLIQQFPDSDYAKMAQPHIKTCVQHLAAHELYVAEFYYNKKKYEAALKRLQGLLKQYPDVGVQHKALQYITKCEKHLSEAARNAEAASSPESEEASQK